MIRIDGSEGEGGGQVLRTALSLSMATGRGFKIHGIRAGRSKPGLMRQHLTAVQAAARICGARVKGDVPGSSELEFIPGPLSGGVHSFAVGTAGSAMLVFQTIALPLALHGKASQVTITGGTHNPGAPPFEFVAECWLPLVRRMGFKISLSLDRPGYYPAGGGRIQFQIEPHKTLSPLELMDGRAARVVRAEAVVNNLPASIAGRQLSIISRRLELDEDRLNPVVTDSADGPGNFVSVRMSTNSGAAMESGFGTRGVSAEKVAEKICDAAVRFMSTDVPVGDCLADQLLLPMALSGGGAMRFTATTSHFLTNLQTIRAFIPFEAELQREARLAWRLRAGCPFTVNDCQ